MAFVAPQVGEVEWFMSPQALLNSATPAATLVTDPARVLRAAYTEFLTDVQGAVAAKHHLFQLDLMNSAATGATLYQ